MKTLNLLINNCDRCPYKCVVNPTSKPACCHIDFMFEEEQHRELPYTTGKHPVTNAVMYKATNVIPDWCPLEDVGE